MDFTAGQCIVIALWTFICAGIAYQMGKEAERMDQEDSFQKKIEEMRRQNNGQMD